MNHLDSNSDLEKDGATHKEDVDDKSEVISTKNDLGGVGERNLANDVELGVAGSDGVPEKVPWTFIRCIAVASLCIAYVGSQILLYFTGGALTYIARDVYISLTSWLPNANLLAVASTLPFVGHFTDLVGRRWTVIGGAALVTIGSILVASCYSFAQGILGMIFGGIGAGICGLTALAGVAEITPVRYRGATLALVTVSIVPFFPYVLYVNMFQQAAFWRWAIAMEGLWNRKQQCHARVGTGMR